MSTPPAPDAAALLAAGDPAAALKALQGQVRGNAADPKLRVFLFQLLCVLGQWQRARDQLKVCGELDAGALAMVGTYDAALQCEPLREAVFAGKTTPHVFGPPAPWLALLVQALQLDAQGHAAQAAAVRAQAFEQAPGGSGNLDGQPFEWIADADSRLGPVLEVIVNGRYGWLPFAHVRQLDIEPVADLRDLVWAPAHIALAGGDDTVALLPVRYVGSTEGQDAGLLMARKTEWLEMAAGDDLPSGPQYRGLGQRLLATDAAEAGLLDVRRIVFDSAAPAA